MAVHAAPGLVTDDIVVEVAILRWPEDSAALALLADAGLPRLLLVDAGVDPPTEADCRQDWVRMPAEDREIELRVRVLRSRAQAYQSSPTLDGFGRLLHRGRWVALSPVEEALARPLVAALSSVVTYDDLLRSAWPDAEPSENALRLHLMRLRRKLERLGLEVRSVRSCGVVLEEARPVASGRW